MRPACDWEILRKMRAGFLHAEKGLADYWETPAHVALYDQFFAGRIGWKWDAVLAELTTRGFQPEPGPLVDWGCGSGVATRRFLNAFPGNYEVCLWDRSPLALRFANESIRAAAPHVSLTPWRPSAPPSDATWLLSHVLNELDESELTRLLTTLAANAESILWVEPGTYAASRRLIAVREQLRAHFSLIGPCPHQAVCGLLTSENAPHWCHHFTRPPAEVHHDPDWSDFARELEIDLGSVPYAYIALSRRTLTLPGEKVLGRPRFFKGHAKLLTCEYPAVTEKVLQKRDDPVRFKLLQKGK